MEGQAQLSGVGGVGGAGGVSEVSTRTGFLSAQAHPLVLLCVNAMDNTRAHATDLQALRSFVSAFCRRFGVLVSIPVLTAASLFSLGNAFMWGTYWDTNKAREAFALSLLLAAYAMLLVDRKLRRNSDLLTIQRCTASALIVAAVMAIEFFGRLALVSFQHHHRAVHH